ncbi:t-SNARE [Basidiobolus meristosporus CBS 931.73]|uniref:t-SNARE n=1 Tax=Basidiobolus meristosporus CBS 931.73 TaxID=1314790 RepID=A0A1Y1XE51_9FUNG|nr:t-SNARE [Basidiobolus meristosporus CBS 931.73]|eukprot:ORX84005.1 t-SNARE [Basidiobolus meristosporus CBS 931.73]
MSFNDLERGLGPVNSILRGSDGNPQIEYKHLVQKIAQKTYKISSNVTSIQRLVSFMGTLKDSPVSRDELHHLAETTRDLVKEVGNDIKDLGNYEASTPREARQRKLEQQKLSKDFQKVLEQFQAAQRLSAEKSREYVDRAKRLSARDDVYEDEEADGVPEEQPLLENAQRRLQLESLDNDIEFNENLIAEREVEIREIEQGITELNEIFRDLGTIVNEQQSLLDNIESNVTSMAVHVRNAAEELGSAATYQKKARNKLCCLLLIFAVIAVVIVLLALA